jgi:hypothetical protein
MVIGCASSSTGRSCLRRRQKSAPDVIGDVTVQRLVRAIEPELSDGGREFEIHLQTLLHPGAPVLEVDRSPIVEDLLPLLRGRRIGADIPAAVHVGQLAIADNLHRLEPHQPVATAERVGGARHELQFGSRSLTSQANRHRGDRGNRHRRTNQPLAHRSILVESGAGHSLPMREDSEHRVDR